MDVVLVGAIIGGVAVLLAAILPRFLDRLHERRQQANLRSVKVKRIEDPGHEDVLRALRLYERRIPPNERDEFDDIIRWLHEVRDETKKGVCKLQDYFLVAKVGDDLAGFAYVQFYPQAALAFFSFLVVDDLIPEARYCRVSTELLKQVRMFLEQSGRCRAIVLEVDEPDVLTGSESREAAARIRHFKALGRMAGCPLKSLRMSYVQPGLQPSASASTEIRLRLMYAALKPDREPDRLHKRDVGDLLDFLSGCVYGDHFEHRADLDSSYRRYLRDWKARVLQTTPEVVELE